EIVGHRLAYVPCPFRIDQELLLEGIPVADVIEEYIDTKEEIQKISLKSAVRFDFDPFSAKPGHTAAHMTVNSSDCRIACVAPLHALRFVDFVFRIFYSGLHHAHRDFFGK